jgi:hypothetical protein
VHHLLRFGRNLRSALLAVDGIVLTASVFIANGNDGTLHIGSRMTFGLLRFPDTDRDFDWRQAVGPVLIALSVLVTLAGNVVWLASG